MSAWLSGIRVLEIGHRAAAICGRLFAELGAETIALRPAGAAEPASPEEWQVFDARKQVSDLDLNTAQARGALAELMAGADLVVLDLPPAELAALDLEPAAIQRAHPRAVVAAITPFGLSGPYRDYRASDLITFHASGIARLLVGAVGDTEAEPPVRASGEQADFIAGITAACAAMHALYAQRLGAPGVLIDVSAQEALSLMAPRELAMPGFGGRPAARGGAGRGGGAVIAVLPASDGFIAVSPREDHQWTRWLRVLGDPEWGGEERFATRATRTTHYPALYERMSQWSRTRSAADIVEACRAEHVPCFPFAGPRAMLDLPQLNHRHFVHHSVDHAADLAEDEAAPTLLLRPPYGLAEAAYAPRSNPGATRLPRWRDPPNAPAASPATSDGDRLPLAGVRVLDFSWVIAGPTATRYLALMGADVIKVEVPGRPDTGRVSELHDVLGQSKRAISLDLKAPGALDAVHRLVASSDVVVENFATGVMERLGLGYETLRELRKDVVLVSASGLGRTGPDAERPAYGNLLSAFSGFAALNGYPGHPPRTGMAWADPLCGLLLAFGAVAALRQRDRTGEGCHIDFSMLEALLWTMPRTLIESSKQGAEPQPTGNDDARYAPHDVYRCAGDDRWIAIAITDDREWQALCHVVPDLAQQAAFSAEQRRGHREAIDGALKAWARSRDAIEAMHELQAAGVPASATFDTTDLFAESHLWTRGFYDVVVEPDGTERILPGLPWHWGDDSLVQPRAAPAVGQHTAEVLREIAGLDDRELAELQAAGAFGVETS